MKLLPVGLLCLCVGTSASSAGSDAAAVDQGAEPTAKTSLAEKPMTLKHTNHLIHATSPYLLQHAHNPVDWYEWGDEAFAKAVREDKPIFLSIGYAACHWCHVMAHECFESHEIAALLNEHFVNIKVDREERPDIDELYMAFTQQLTGSGGWPMSVWIRPDGAPFHAGTYFPREAFGELLTAIADAWRNDRDAITEGADRAKDFFAAWDSGFRPADDVVTSKAVDEAAATLAGHFDRALGGVASGGSNKFPPCMSMDLLLRVYRRTGNGDLFAAMDTTLDHMARGGIYDHIGGGICRYSTDREWLVPHFEKMLYDQALVSSIYLDGFQVSRKEPYAAVAADIFDYVLADLRSPEGAFYSSVDADSGGFEGAYYIWTVEQVQALLGDDEAKLFCEYFDVTASGNWFEQRGHAPAGPKNVLRIQQPAREFAQARGLPHEEFVLRLRGWREKAAAARKQRVAPALDDKILTGWNGLMIASLAKGARVLDKPKYAGAAADAARFVLGKLRKDGRLLRTYRNGESRLTAYLSDYAFMIEALLNLHEATFEETWLDEAVALTDAAIRFYYDEQRGGFYFTASDGQKLLARSKSPFDGAIPSGNSVMTMNLLRLSLLLDRKDYRKKAEATLRAFTAPIARSPGAFDRMLCAADFYHDRVKEVAIIGDLGSSDTTALIRTVFDRYLPNKVVVHASDAAAESKLPLLKGKKKKQGRATAYVCQNYTCKLPVTEPEALGRQLDGE